MSHLHSRWVLRLGQFQTCEHGVVLDDGRVVLAAVNIFIKDLGIVLDAARKLSFPLPLASAAHQLYLATAAAGYGGEDDSAVIKYYAMLAGLELPKAQDPP